MLPAHVRDPETAAFWITDWFARLGGDRLVPDAPVTVARQRSGSVSELRVVAVVHFADGLRLDVNLRLDPNLKPHWYTFDLIVPTGRLWGRHGHPEQTGFHRHDPPDQFPGGQRRRDTLSSPTGRIVPPPQLASEAPPLWNDAVARLRTQPIGAANQSSQWVRRKCMKYGDYTSLDFEFPEPGILRIVFRNPGRKNSVSPDQHSELARVWSAIDLDPEVRVVIVTGADGVFSAGGDFSLIESMAHDHEARLKVMREARDIVYGVIHCSKPIVSAMAGPAVGAGLAVGLLADVSIATPSAKIIDGHTRLGVAAGDHAAIIWPLLCGMAKAKYHLLTCTPVSGEEAERIGLVSLCVAEDELQDKALEVARSLATGSQSAIRWTKYALNGWLRSAGPIFDVSVAYETLGFAGPDVVEGMAAIKERRVPNFTGPAAE